MREFIGDAKEKIILDIGAGKNPISRGIRTKKTIRLDGDKSQKPDICCNLNKTRIPCEDDSIDIIIAGEIIEHLFNPLLFFKECYRILKKKGALIISTPNICSIKNRFKVFFGCLPEYCSRNTSLDNSRTHNFKNHVSDFNMVILKEFLTKARFEILQKTTNGIISRNRVLFPLKITPSSLGEVIILKCIKK